MQSHISLNEEPKAQNFWCMRLPRTLPPNILGPCTQHLLSADSPMTPQTGRWPQTVFLTEPQRKHNQVCKVETACKCGLQPL